LVNRARSFIYSTAPLPAIAFAAERVLRDILPGEDGAERRKRLFDNVRSMAAGLDLPEIRAYAADQPPSAIMPLIVGDEAAALDLSERVLAAGFLIPAIRYPTVPRGQARLRLTLSAGHGKIVIGQTINVLREILVD
jgi:8-amino-7-oxononanoate synthase